MFILMINSRVNVMLSMFSFAIFVVGAAVNAEEKAAVDAYSEPSLFQQQPRGLSFGHLEFFPEFDYDLEYTDNATRAPDHTKTDVLEEFLPSFRADFVPHELVTARVSYEFGVHDYIKNEARDYLSHKASGDIGIGDVLLKGLSVTIHDDYIQSGNSSVLENEILSFARYERNFLVPKISYEFNRFLVSEEYKYGRFDYFEKANEANDYLLHGGLTNVQYRVLPQDRLNVFGSYEFNRFYRDINSLSDFDTHTALMGVNGKFSKLDYSVGAGIGVADLLHQNISQMGPDLQATVAYNPHDRLSFNVTASRKFVAGVSLGITTETNAGVGATFVVFRHLKATLGYAIDESARPKNIDILTRSLSAGFEYRINRLASLNANYIRVDRTGNIGKFDSFRSNEAIVGFRLSW